LRAGNVAVPTHGCGREAVTGSRAWLLAGVVVALVLALATCPPPPEKAVIDRWLLCEECISGELDSVIALGDDATDMLRMALLKGPPSSDREHIRRHAASRYTRLRSPLVSPSRWVDQYESNYVEHYQSHAATALGRIGTPAARAALFEAMQRETRYGRDARRALARAAPLALAVAAGDSQAAPLDSLVLVDPTVALRDSVTGQPLPNVRVVFSVDSGGGRADSVRRTGANGLASVHWSLGPGPDSTNVLRAETFRRSVLFRATSHGFTPRLVFTVQPTNGTQGAPLLPGVRLKVVDAWDRVVSTFSGTAFANLVGTSIVESSPVVNGEIDFSSLVVPAIGTFRIKVLLAGTTPTVSQSFDVVP
jgi:hypothetical protein